jgi:hypothetical protein
MRGILIALALLNGFVNGYPIQQLIQGCLLQQECKLSRNPCSVACTTFAVMLPKIASDDGR